MSKKFSITKTKIDVGKLTKSIREYLDVNNTNLYLFMNKDTIDELISIVGHNLDGLWAFSQVIYVDIFKDIKYFVIIH